MVVQLRGKRVQVFGGKIFSGDRHFRRVLWVEEVATEAGR
jgi:hypothetical protein